jgi:hypothetical protein
MAKPKSPYNMHSLERIWARILLKEWGFRGIKILTEEEIYAVVLWIRLNTIYRREKGHKRIALVKKLNKEDF